MSGWTHDEMPRAFLVKNKPRRSATVDNSEADMIDRHLGDFDSGKPPDQPPNSEGRCPVAEADHEKNRRTIDVTHQAQSDATHANPSQGSR